MKKRRGRAWGCYFRTEGHAERQRPNVRASVTALRGQKQGRKRDNKF